MREKPSGSDDEGGTVGPKLDAQIFNSNVERIGNLAPVQDFEAMMSRRDNPDWINKAINGMKSKIFNLLEDSYEGDTYQKALEYIVALRKGCILEQVRHLLLLRKYLERFFFFFFCYVF